MQKNKNPWNRNNEQRSKSSVERDNKGTSAAVSAETKFKEAQERLQQSVKKHLETQYESSEEEDELETQPILDSVLRNYSQFGGNLKDLERTQNYLENAFQSGAAVCLICIASIKRIDPIWNCESCYGFFHLNCIQRWAKDSIAHLKLVLQERTDKNIIFNWQCPKCRKDYDPKKIPNRYECFCGQTVDPEFQPWLVPHSCGETCNRPLVPECGHKCLLLCHPGPCPPCPKVVNSKCYCGKSGAKQLRCSNKEWSCKGNCGLSLACKKHPCPAQCHTGPCPPCQVKLNLPCLCKRFTKLLSCAQISWNCDKVCGKELSCGLHSCEKICHEGECGECPGTEARSCPCGKSTAVLPCDQEVPTCGGTCDKLLDCRLHRCPQRCHSRPCGTCQEFVEKRCRCGLHIKEVACQKEFLCETKCKRMRDCNAHPCNKKCCDGDCPPCEKRCGKTLGCGQHKCTSICHRGRCYPCQVTKKISCFCGASVVTVPCGKHKPRPPKCYKICKIPPECHHSSQESHRCHFGACPDCKQVCTQLLDCGHSCKAPCHSAAVVYSDIKPSTPWEAMSLPVEVKCLPCPPCSEPVTIKCLGEHETITLPCHEATPRSCGRPCNHPLPCTNHFCQLPCHDLQESSCEDCMRMCEVERKCEHACVKGCHPAPCPPCKANLKLPCHCHITNVFLKCHVWQSSDQQTRDTLLSCGNYCPKTYDCGHRCTKQCHKGNCPGSSMCKKKVKVMCPCKRLKKEFQCCTITAGLVSVVCDDACKEIQLKKIEEEKKASEIARLAAEERNREELEKYIIKMHGKKRTRKRRDSLGEEKGFLSKHIVMITLLVGSIMAICVAAAYKFL